MGQEIACSVLFGDREATGKAVLENNGIIFRGEIRLTIPLAGLKTVSSRDGELHLKWKDGSAVFTLGKHAEKWAHKILNPKSRLEKLGVKPGLVISTVRMKDADFIDDLRQNAARFSSTKPINASDLVFLAVEDLTALSRTKAAASYIGEAGALWIVYPKGRHDIKEQQVLDAGRQAGLTDIKVVSFSATQTALKFVRPKAKRPSHHSTRRA